MSTPLTKLQIIAIKDVYEWVKNYPLECEIDVDYNGNIIVTVITNEQES